MAEARKKVRWATKKRKGGSRVWKTKWVKVRSGSSRAAKPADGKPKAADSSKS